MDELIQEIKHRTFDGDYYEDDDYDNKSDFNKWIEEREKLIDEKYE